MSNIKRRRAESENRGDFDKYMRQEVGKSPEEILAAIETFQQTLLKPNVPARTPPARNFAHAADATAGPASKRPLFAERSQGQKFICCVTAGIEQPSFGYLHDLEEGETSDELRLRVKFQYGRGTQPFVELEAQKVGSNGAESVTVIFKWKVGENIEKGIVDEIPTKVPRFEKLTIHGMDETVSVPRKPGNKMQQGLVDIMRSPKTSALLCKATFVSHGPSIAKKDEKFDLLLENADRNERTFLQKLREEEGCRIAIYQGRNVPDGSTKADWYRNMGYLRDEMLTPVLPVLPVHQSPVSNDSQRDSEDREAARRLTSPMQGAVKLPTYASRNPIYRQEFTHTAQAQTVPDFMKPAFMRSTARQDLDEASGDEGEMRRDRAE